MVSIAWLVLIFSNFWKTRLPPQPIFCWLRILATSDQLKEKLWIYLHQTFYMDIRWHKLGWYWFSTISEKQNGRYSQFSADLEFWRCPATANFLLTQNIDGVRSIKGKVMNISSQTFYMDIRWHKLGWYWFSTISEKQDGRHSQFSAESEFWRRPIN